MSSEGFEKYRSKKAQYFINDIGFVYDEKWKAFLKEHGIKTGEHLKLITDSEWENHLKSLGLSNIENRNFWHALNLLRGTGEYDPLKSVQSLPLKDSSSPKPTSQHGSSSSKSKSTNKTSGPSSKSGNMKRLDEFYDLVSVSTSRKKKQKTGVSSSTTNAQVVMSKTSGNFLALEAPPESSWRDNRSKSDTKENISKIKDPALDYQRFLWNKEHLYDMAVEDIPDPIPVCNNFEDYLEYYKCLGENLSRTSSDDDITKAYNSKKEEYRTIIRQVHPDRNGGIDKGAQDIKHKWEKVKDVYSRFESKSPDGTSGRLAYDLECDDLIRKWKVHTKYNDDAARRQFCVEKRYERRGNTTKQREDWSEFEKCIHLYNPKGQQTTEWKLAVFNAIKVDHKQVSEVSREIRKKRGPRNWKGNTTEKMYQNIRQTVNRALRVIASNKFDKEKLQSMSSKDREKVLHGKHTETNLDKKKKTRVLGAEQVRMETELYSYVKTLWNEKKRVTRLIIFRKAIEIHPLFKGGRKNNPKFFSCMKTWFYKGFCRRYDLSYTRIAGASRKLPPNWRELQESIQRRVAKSQVERKEGYLIIPAVPDERLANTDHIPMYRDMAGAYSWTKKGAGGGTKKKFRGQVATGGGEKDRFTVQLTCLKSGGKVKPFIIFKAKPADGRREFDRRTVSYELKNRKPDAAGNSYPAEDKVFLTCNTTATSNGDFTKLILKEVIFPELGVFEGKRSGVLVDDFKGHSNKVVKDYVLEFKSGDDDDDEEDRYQLVDFNIMAGGITPVCQPIDMIVGKVFKGNYRDLYDDYMLTAPKDSKGHPIIPSRQLCATWVVEAWEQVPESLICKAWELAKYKSIDEIEREDNGSKEIEKLSQKDIVDAIAPVVDERILFNYFNEDNVYDVDEFDDEYVCN